MFKPVENKRFEKRNSEVCHLNFVNSLELEYTISLGGRNYKGNLGFKYIPEYSGDLLSYYGIDLHKHITEKLSHLLCDKITKHYERIEKSNRLDNEEKLKQLDKEIEESLYEWI